MVLERHKEIMTKIKYLGGLFKGILHSVNYPFQERWRTKLCAWSWCLTRLCGALRVNPHESSHWIRNCEAWSPCSNLRGWILRVPTLLHPPCTSTTRWWSLLSTSHPGFGLGHLQVRWVDFNHANEFCDRGFSFATVRLFVAALKSIWTITGCSWMWRNSTWSFLEH